MLMNSFMRKATLVAAVSGPGSLAAQAPVPAAPTANYWVYVGAESADAIYRIRFGPGGTAVEKTIAIGELAAEMEGYWEFPGGKVDPGESDEAALVREIREELDAGVEVGRLVLATTHHYPERSVCLAFYECALTEEPRPLLGQEMRWVSPPELRSLTFPPADEELIALLTGSL